VAEKDISTLRIIGGKWRSRKLQFQPLPGLRPTPNRVRETLFNWLAPVIVDASCLDLFSGSGALGFEALSRGAKNVVMVDQSPATIAMLKKNAHALGATEIEFYCAKVPEPISFLQNRKFDIVFLDPPFQQGLIPTSLRWLKDGEYLAHEAYIYVEAEKSFVLHPEGWQVLRHKKAGQVQYFLLRNVSHDKQNQ
jgi:16S rRNA (guanine966-N2)-methyltransferase